MTFKAAAMSLLLLSAAGQAAEDEIEPLDGDFLDYLANMEGDDDDWTVLAEADQDPSASEANPAEPEKTSKEAAQPAAEER